MAPLRALTATLDRDERTLQEGDEVPLCWHWLYFLPSPRQSEIGVDGHPRRGGFLPPVPLPRRMWAASHIEFRRPLLVGESITKASTIADVSRKDGRTGPLVFVRIHHEISATTGVAIVEDQDLVYREMPKSGEGTQSSKAVPDNEQFSRNVTADPVLLFRYSALTFNSHRIHYDRPYAMGEEGYPGLVIHGPLIATLLMGELTKAHPRVRVTTFEFRAVSPLFDTAPFTVCGRRDDAVVNLWARGPQGQLAMSATATVSDDTQQ